MTDPLDILFENLLEHLDENLPRHLLAALPAGEPPGECSAGLPDPGADRTAGVLSGRRLALHGAGGALPLPLRLPPGPGAVTPSRRASSLWGRLFWGGCFWGGGWPAAGWRPPRGGVGVACAGGGGGGCWGGAFFRGGLGGVRLLRCGCPPGGLLLRCLLRRSGRLRASALSAAFFLG